MPLSKTMRWLLVAALFLVHPCIANLDRSGLSRFRNLLQTKKNLSDDEDKGDTSSCNSTSCYRYYSPKTAPFFIESWPGVDFETGEFYGGSIPINESDPSRTLFFIFKPATQTPVDEVTIWLQGGPGCSSLLGFFSENGPISWQPGTGNQKAKNRYAWSEMTNMLWVDNGVGVGFSQGKVTARNEIDIAKDFLGFFKSWEKLFEIKHYKIYMTVGVVRSHAVLRSIADHSS